MALAAIALGACGGDSIDADDVRGPGSTGPATSTTADDGPRSEDLLDLVIADIEDFWAEEYSDVYAGEYEPLTGGVHPYTQGDPPPPCGERLVYDDVAGNAFYCSLGDYVAWDDQQLFPDLADEFGPFANALVLAHEWGHVVQERSGTTGPTILLEQQADCFAGAWTAWLADDRSARLSLDDVALDTALAGFLEFRDEPGTPASSASAHGLGFDRVSAFQDGFEDGTARCVAYDDDPPIVLQDLFEQQGSFTPGNLPYEEAIPLAVENLNTYWSAVLGADFTPITDVVLYDVTGDPADLPKCGAASSDPELLADAVLYCALTNTVAWDDAFLRSVNDGIGDFGAAILLANQWSRAVQESSDIDSNGPDAGLHNDCLTGTWVAHLLLGRSETMSLTPDDVDEIIQAFLTVNLGVAESEVTGERLAFERIQALRDGLVDGLDGCAPYAP